MSAHYNTRGWPDDGNRRSRVSLSLWNISSQLIYAINVFMSLHGALAILHVMLLLLELVLVLKALPAHLGVGVPHEPVPPLPGLSPEVGAHARVRLVLTAKLGQGGILFFNKHPLDLRAGAGDSCPLALPSSLATAVLATAGAGAGAG